MLARTGFRSAVVLIEAVVLFIYLGVFMDFTNPTILLLEGPFDAFLCIRSRILQPRILLPAASGVWEAAP